MKHLPSWSYAFDEMTYKESVYMSYDELQGYNKGMEWNKSPNMKLRPPTTSKISYKYCW